MTRLTRSALVLATALGLAGTATTARADHDDRWRDHDGDEHGRVTVVVPAPIPAYVPAPAPAYAVAPPYVSARWHGGRYYHELREEYRRLDLARDRFYATWDGNPWRRDRFEAWYAGRRAELDARWTERARWSGHDRW